MQSWWKALWLPRAAAEVQDYHRQLANPKYASKVVRMPFRRGYGRGRSRGYRRSRVPFRRRRMLFKRPFRMRRRRFRRRGRRFARRRAGLSTKILLNPRQAKSVVVNLPLLLTYSLDPSSVNMGYASLAINDIADPSAGGGARRPRGYAKMYDWYSSARVLSTWFNIRVVGLDGDGQPARIGYWIDTDSAPADTTIAEGQRKAMFYKGGKYKTLMIASHSGATGLGTAFKGVIDGRKYHRESDPRDDKWTVTDGANLGATELTYMHIYAGAASFVGDLGVVYIEVRLNFKVMFFDPVVQTTLEADDV